MGRLYLAIAFASASLGSASVQAAVGPVPQWIWIDAYPGRPQSAWFLRTFDAPAGIERAELMGMADDRMTVYVNGTEVGAVQGTKQAATFDVTGQVRAGVNTLAVEAHNASGPAGVLLRLRIVAVDGREQTIVTDDAWVGTTKPPAEWLQSTFRDTAWPPVVSFGLLGVRPWAAPTGETEAYNQWKQALATGVADAATNIAAMPGFQVELMRSSQGDESSWVSLAFDPQGRITLAREGRSGGKGLLRLTLPESPGGESRMEVLNETLEECRGLLYAHGSLYANANNSRGLYRLRDTDGDDTLDEVKLLRATGGGVGHGRNDLTLGPDGRIYLVHGNNVLLPDDYQPGASPFRNFGPDRLRPCFWDRTLFDAGVEPLAGHVVRTDADGQTWELMAGGFRNAFGLDFNADGELFTYDADMEWDAGAPWYKPTRINHVVSGGEYGFRQGTANRPAYLPDNWPSNLDIGLGSPTSVKFGTHSNFPPRYRRALFVLDWAYGKIYAIHLTPRGASYTCSAEVFVEGRPLNVTDIDFGPDGAMYFTTGGRDTQSGLYRVRYVGPDVADEPNAGAAIQSQLAADARARRRRLEAFHGRVDPAAVDEAWFHLDSPDPWLRNAARVAIEAQPVDAWRGRALAESRPTAALTAMMALARIGGAADQPAIFERLAALSMNELAIEQQLTAVRCYALACARLGRPPAEAAARITAKVGPLFPSRISPLDQQLCELLAYLEAPELVPRTVPLLASSETIEDRLCWLYMLRNVRGGWTPADRQAYFRALNATESETGGVYLPTFVSYIRTEATAWLSDDERRDLAELLGPAESTVEIEPLPPPRPVVREWTMEDLAGGLEAASHGRDFERGQALYAEALCNRCHRLGDRGRAQGPDLTGVAKRFNTHDLLVSIVQPSKVIDEKYRGAVLETRDGQAITGRIVGGSETVLLVATDPLDPRQTREVPLADIETQAPAPLSIMPAGLLNTLTRDEILDLLAYVQANGDREHPSFEE